MFCVRAPPPSRCLVRVCARRPRQRPPVAHSAAAAPPQLLPPPRTQLPPPPPPRWTTAGPQAPELAPCSTATQSASWPRGSRVSSLGANSPAAWLAGLSSRACAAQTRFGGGCGVMSAPTPTRSAEQSLASSKEFNAGEVNSLPRRPAGERHLCHLSLFVCGAAAAAALAAPSWQPCKAATSCTSRRGLVAAAAAGQVCAVSALIPRSLLPASCELLPASRVASELQISHRAGGWESERASKGVSQPAERPERKLKIIIMNASKEQKALGRATGSTLSSPRGEYLR